MSDLMINVSYSGDDAPPRQREEPVSQFRKKKRLRKKLRQLQSKGLLHGGKQTHHNNHHSAMSGQSRKGHHHHQQAPRQNGELFTTPSTHKDRSLPHTSSTEGNSEPSTSATHSLPSLTVTVVNNKHGGTSPKDSVDNATASSSSSSSPTVVSLADNRRQFKVSIGHKPTAPQTSLGNPAKYVAMDCEMVGTGPKGSISQLARCSVVSYDGDVIYDKFINPSAPVTDYRTRWSGIRRCDLVNAKPYAEARKEILRLFMGKVVIGHAIHNDFKVLNYFHPAPLTRDTSRIPLLNTRAGFAETEVASLKRLTKRIFNRDIQKGRKGHSSVEDARATMELYKVVEEEWERTLANTRK